jgi:hypothetical protein
MRNHTLTAAAGLLGGALAVWSAVPSEGAQTAFWFFIFFYGPAFLLSAAIAIYFIWRSRIYRALWLILLGPVIYYVAGFLAFRELPSSASFPLAGTVAAWIYLAAIKLLVLRSASWLTVFGWGALSVIADFPFVYPVRNLGEGTLGGLWFWGLHILLWYLSVSYAIGKMAGQVGRPPLGDRKRT